MLLLASSFLVSELTVLRPLITILIRPCNLPLATLRIIIRAVPQRKTVSTALVPSWILLILLTHPWPPRLAILPTPIKAHLARRTLRPIIPSTDILCHGTDAHSIARRPACLEVARVDDTVLEALVTVVDKTPAAADGVDGLWRLEVLTGARASCDAGAVGIERDAVEGAEAVTEGAAAAGADFEGRSRRHTRC